VTPKGQLDPSTNDRATLATSDDIRTTKVDWAQAAKNARLAIEMGRFLDEQVCFQILTDPLATAPDKARARQRLEELDQNT